MPEPFKALSNITGGCHGAASPAVCGCEANKRNALLMWACARVAACGSRSVLLINTRSANSMIPFLMACKSSPALGSCITANKSVMPDTAVSLWPTPTVSTITTSYPAASHTKIHSRVFSATPPKLPLLGLGRINALGCTDKCSILVLSPKIDPPDTDEEGSIASTATRCPCPIKNKPRASMKVLLPTPGTPLKPSRKALPVWGSMAVSKSSAHAR